LHLIEGIWLDDPAQKFRLTVKSFLIRTKSADREIYGIAPAQAVAIDLQPKFRA